MLCLKKKKFWGSSSSYGPQSQSKNHGAEQGNGNSSGEPSTNRRVTREASRAKDMAPPPAAAPAVHPVVREVTEDTPPDLLEGTMDLMVILPTGKTVQTTVDRKTPMMDLLIHTATANKINPAGHIVQVRNERGIEMPYKPSTPIGALDTTTIEIVPKNRVNEYIIVKKPAKVANQPFETTFRLQVHLPRNQLHVMRVSSKVVLDDVLREVCHEKNLDISKYEIRHPVNLDQKLPLSLTVGETGLQELTVVSKNSKINSSVSTADIIALQQSEEGRGKGCLDGSFKHSRSSVGDSSVSSESTGSGRGISPCRSEDSRSISPLPLIRPKTLVQNRTTSNLSTCSSSGNSSTGQFKTNTLNSSVMSSQASHHQQVIMQAPPRTKKRAAPQPPTTPVGAKVNNSNTSLNCSSTSLNVSSPNATCTTPTNGLAKAGVPPGVGVPLERPTPRKKEAPREPPKPHHPLSHHQSLPLNNHVRHHSGSNVTDVQQGTGSLDRQDSQQRHERGHQPVITKMSSRQSMSSSMTNLTSVSSVSSTSLASSTGGSSKKRRAPKPPVLAAVHPPTQIEEETTATDSEASTLRDSDGANGSNKNSPQKQQSHSNLSKTNGTAVHRGENESFRVVASENSSRVPDDPKESEILSASPVSSLSSPSNSASESNSSSPIPPSSMAQVTMKAHQSDQFMNTNEEAGLRSGRSSSAATGSHHEDQYYESDRPSSIRSYSRSSRSPSSSSNINAGASSPPHADSVVSSRNVISSNAAATTVDQDAQSSSCRPPSSNTQVSPLPTSSSATSASARAMPMPLPRRRAPPAPSENSFSSSSASASNANNHAAANAPVPTKKVSNERSSMPLQQQENKSKLLLEKAAALEQPQQQRQQQNFPMPKPKPRPDRKSMESISSQTSQVIKPQTNQASPNSRLAEMKSNQSTDSNPDSLAENDTNTSTAAEQQLQPVLSGQLRNPLAKYGVKVLPDNVLKERAERLKKTESSADSNLTSPPYPLPSSNANASSSHHVDNAQPTQVTHHQHHRKIPIERASKSSSSNTDEFSDTGSITSLTKIHNISSGSIGRSGLASKPAPSLSKSDYTSQGSVRSIKQLTSAVASMNSVESANYNDDGSGEGGYESDNLEENLDFFEPANENRSNVIGNVGRESSLTKSVSSSPSQRTTSSSGPTFKQTATTGTGRQNEKKEMLKTGNKLRVFSSVSAYDGNDPDDESTNLIKSPGTVSESGFGRNAPHRGQVMMKRKSVEEDDTKLNRWQNMVSLNEIENGNRNKDDQVNDKSGRLYKTSSNRKDNQFNRISPAATTNKSNVSTRSVLSGSSASNKQNAATLLQGDYHQRTKVHLADESHNHSATCHSSESEASYTDSGVPATETVTPSPVNLDDVILDHEYQVGSHSEKFSSEDGEELKHSSRRSSIQSDHSEEWMNILEAKMNKDEEAIEKMFEAVLPPAEEINGYTPSPPPTLEEGTKLSDGSTMEMEQESKEIRPVSQNESRKRREILTDSEDDDYERNNKEIENDDYKEMIETTVELHHVPRGQAEETEEANFLDSTDSPTTSPVDDDVMASGASSLPIRKLSKSESFSHNSEFNEANQRRKNFKSARSNAVMNRSSQSTGSASDLRHSMSMSDSEDELEELVERKLEVGNKQAGNDRTVSMSDLSARRLETTKSEKASNETGSAVHKATSLQKLSGEMPNVEEAEQVETYRKRLEMQFEQWKTEFMKQHGGKMSGEMNETIPDEVERTRYPQVVKSKVEELKETEKLEEDTPEEIVEQPQQVNAVEAHLAVVENKPETEASTATEEVEQKAEHKESELLEEKVDTKEVSTPVGNQKANEEMKNANSQEFPPVELRKTKEVVYQYSGPPTIKMASWGDRPHRTVSVKQDKDYIMGMGQQDPSTKAANPGRIHSFHGGPIVNTTYPPQQTTEINKRESSPSPSPHIQVNKGWSVAINAPNVLPNSTGAVKSVLSAWKQRMEETEKEKSKAKEGPPAEIDIYGTDNATRSNETSSQVNQTSAVSSFQQQQTPNGVANIKSEITDKSGTSEKNLPSKIKIENHATKPVVIDTKPMVKVAPPKVPEKAKTLGSSFRTPEKPVVFTINSMESNTLPRQKSTTTTLVNNIESKTNSEVVDSTKPSPATSVVDVSSNTSTLEDRKKFFQGIKPVENGKEAPVPAANMKSNIAAIQKVFEKQRMTKMQQMGSQQSLYSDGTVSPVPSLQRNDSLESRESTLRRQNSIESHSSDSSSVVLRVSPNSAGKASSQMSATEMVQKLFGRPTSMNTFDPLRRTPSPISSTTSTLSSSTSYERFTPSPTVVDGPNNSIRITTGGYKPPASSQLGNIRSVGNKAIIIVNGEDSVKNKAATRDNKPLRSSVNDNIILTENSNVKKSPVSNAYVSSILQQQQKQPINRISAPPASQSPAPASVAQLKQSSSPSNSPLKKAPSVTNEPASVSQKNVRNAQANGTGIPPPPPPPPTNGVATTPKSQLSLDVKKMSPSEGNLRTSKPSTPTTPTSPDPRAEMINAIKNSNGNFGLRKTGSTILLK